MHDGLAWVLHDPLVRAVHLSLLPQASAPKDALTQHQLEGLKLKMRAQGETSLLPKEKKELLQDAEAIQVLSAETESADSDSGVNQPPGRVNR